MEPSFLKVEDLLYFHSEEIKITNSPPDVRDKRQLEAAVEAPKATFEGKYLQSVFEMAATYVQSVCKNHPFLDGNKRVAAISAIAFLRINGYNFFESYEGQLADVIFDFLNKKKNKADLTKYFESNSEEIT